MKADDVLCGLYYAFRTQTSVTCTCALASEQHQETQCLSGCTGDEVTYDTPLQSAAHAIDMAIKCLCIKENKQPELQCG